MISHILTPVDGSEASLRAVDLAADLANTYGAKLTLMHVLAHFGSAQIPEELLEYSEIEHVRVTEMDVLRSVSNEILKHAQAKAFDLGVKQVATTDDVGDAAKHIVSYAKEHAADLIVMGTRGLGVAKELMLGSVSHKVIHLAHCPCATVH